MHIPFWAPSPSPRKMEKSALVSLLETVLKRRDPHYNENEEHLIQFTLDWSPSYLRVYVTLWLSSMSMQSTFIWYIVLWPPYKTSPTGRVYFGCVSSARLPSGCLSFGLSVDQHITTASNSQCTLIWFDFFNFCFSQAAGSCCDSILSCPLSIFVTCLMKCVESDLPWPVHDMLKKMLILSYLAAAFRNATVSLRGLTSTLARCQNYQPLPCKCTHSCDITVCVWRMLQLNEWMRAEGK